MSELRDAGPRHPAQTGQHHDTLPEDGDQTGSEMLARIASGFRHRPYTHGTEGDVVTLHWGIPNAPSVTIKLSDDRKTISINVGEEVWKTAANNHANKWLNSAEAVVRFDWIIERVDAYMINPKHHLLRLMCLKSIPAGLSVEIDGDLVVRLRRGKHCFLICITDLVRGSGHALSINTTHSVEVTAMIETLKGAES